MDDNLLKVVIGGMLHETSKVLNPGGQYKNNRTICVDFLKEAGINDSEILEQVAYCSDPLLKMPKMPDSSLAYLTRMASDIAEGRVVKQIGGGGVESSGNKWLESVFNIINGNHQKYGYKPDTLNEEKGINHPVQNPDAYDESFYPKILKNIKDKLRYYILTKDYVNTLLGVLEANLAFVPSSTYKDQPSDISLYDHVKMTAAIGSCLYKYLESKGIKNFRDELHHQQQEFYTKKAFLLFEMDMSGIQDFIYTVSSKGALKALRSRSFYLEIMLEHLIDELIDSLGLTRSNLIYSGGGHAYILLPNTETAKQIIHDFERDTNQWFLKTFKTALYVACVYSECNANDMWNIPEGSYKSVFRTISTEIASKKLNRYSYSDIQYLNNSEKDQYEKECSVCKRMDLLSGGNKCSICKSLEGISSSILSKSIFTVVSKKTDDVSLPLPGNKFLVSDTEKTVYDRMDSSSGYVRCYRKNDVTSGLEVTTKLWIGDYTDERTFEELAKDAEGIGRIAVLRADVDNLGQAFVSGFENNHSVDKNVSLTRTATFSRKMSEFFKLHMNYILKNGEYRLNGEEGIRPRRATVVYSGGDDVFVVGSWDDIIGFTVDLYRNFKKYTQNTLTLSAGIGIYPAKYPINVIAKETGELENSSKSVPGKNSITLFDNDSSYPRDEFIEKVLGEKYELIKRFFYNSEERGKNFMYNLLHLLENRSDHINLARYAYLLARLAPKDSADNKQKESYQNFSRRMYEWMQSEEDCRQLITAVNIYAYITRGKGDEDIG